ncbi:MAG: response regulator transcription factor [Chloroflexi bacterium]|nr:response regulator transcription factor [Chloroflexota bacterium]
MGGVGRYRPKCHTYFLWLLFQSTSCQDSHLVLLDLRLPNLSGIEVMRQVHPQVSGVRFLVLTTYDTDEYVAPALTAGAQGYLLKDATPEELSRAVRALMQGGAALEPAVAARLLERMSENDGALVPLERPVRDL